MKLTQDEYKHKLALANPNVELIGEYKGRKVKTLHYCKNHSNSWSVAPENVLAGKGCPLCRSEKISAKKILTLDGYLKKLSVSNPDICLIGEYHGRHTKTMHYCKKHSVSWEVTPDNVLSGKGCPICSKERRGQSRRKTHEQYVHDVEVISPFISVLETYVNSQIPILHLCTKHNIKWKARPYNILTGKCCPECKKEKMHNSQACTPEEYRNKLKVANPAVIPIGEYVNASTPIDHYHMKCGHVTKMSPSSALSGKGCILCKGKKISAAFLRTQEDFEKAISKISPTVEICGTYINSKSDINCRCKVCGRIWSARAQHLVAGHGCPECSAKLHGKSLRKTQEQFIEDMQYINPYIKITGKYTTCKNKISCECLNCGYKWTPVAGDIEAGRGCPKCKETIGERKIRAYLEHQNITYVKNMRFENLIGLGGKLLSYDFYLPTFRLLIEFQGEQHERPIELFGGEEMFKKQLEHDRRKKNYAMMHGYNLLEIFYKDMDNIESILDNHIKLLQSETVTTTGVV